MADSTSRLSDALGDRYRIIREAGAGGMATVFLAEDVKHRRKVAIKVLRAELAASLGAERFLREIEIAAGLQHPNIVGLLDSGLYAAVEGGQPDRPYYVMPFVEGESLRQRLARQGELPVGEAVRLLAEITDALAHAHRRGVVHRDMKPDNVMLSERHALVTDFGVAAGDGAPRPSPRRMAAITRRLPSAWRSARRHTCPRSRRRRIRRWTTGPISMPSVRWDMSYSPGGRHSPAALRSRC